MSKRIVYCSDGTWQSPLKNTNVYRIYKALSVSADQVTYYDDGIGADAMGLDRFVQGAFGRGLVQKVIDGYTKISHVYEEGDEVYIFGFSRGAYTARSLAGMIAACGVPRGRFSDDCVSKAFAAYRDPVHRTSLLADLKTCGLADVCIRMVGVWDTVGSLGIPAIFGAVDQKAYGFLDTRLNPDVKNAYHALAIDEQRAQFSATLWDETNLAPGQTIEQVWFAGCHSDVGGGTPMGSTVDGATRLSDIPLAWMITKAKALGLTFDPAALAQYVNIPPEIALDRINDAWNAAQGPASHRKIPDNAHIANSVALRIQYALTYAPPNLKIVDSALSDTYSMIDLVNPDAALTA